VSAMTPVQLFAPAQAVASPLGARAFVSEDPESRLLSESRQLLLEHEWSGNIRELANAAHAAVLVSRDGVIRPRDLRLQTRLPRPSSAPFDLIAQQLRRLFVASPPDLYRRRTNTRLGKQIRRALR